MTDDDKFEARLKSLVEPLVLHDPTPCWKQEILNHAKTVCEVEGLAFGRSRPKWMIAMLAAAWVLIGLMKVTMPAGDLPGRPTQGGFQHVSKNGFVDAPTVLPLLASRLQTQSKLLELP